MSRVSVAFVVRSKIMIKYLLFVCIMLWTQTSIVFATPETPSIITKVENPEHYDSLAKSHKIFEEVFNGWVISSVSIPLEQSKVVSFTVKLQAPAEITADSIPLELVVGLRFANDSLINFERIKSANMQLTVVLKNIERNRFARLFRNNASISSRLINWVGGYSFELRSENGDTLAIGPKLATSARESRVLWFSFNSPYLLDYLEVFMGAAAFTNIPEFKKKVGIGYVKYTRDQLLVSSGKDFSGINSCFTSRGRVITTYKLSMKYDWSNFPYFTEAVKRHNYYIISETRSKCVPVSMTDKLFAILSPSAGKVSGRVYLPLDCEKRIIRFISFPVEKIEDLDQRPVIQSISVIDSLLETLK